MTDQKQDLERLAFDGGRGGEENPFPGDWEPMSDQERSKIGREFVAGLVGTVLGAHVRPSPVCPERKRPTTPPGPWIGTRPVFDDASVNLAAPSWHMAAGMYYRTFGCFPGMERLTDWEREDITSGAWAQRHPRS